jgi:hypothetical protein
MIGNFKLPLAVFNRFSIFRKFKSVVSVWHNFLRGSFPRVVKLEANTCKLGVAMAAKPELAKPRPVNVR